MSNEFQIVTAIYQIVIMVAVGAGAVFALLQLRRSQRRDLLDIYQEACRDLDSEGAQSRMSGFQRLLHLRGNRIVGPLALSHIEHYLNTCDGEERAFARARLSLYEDDDAQLAAVLANDLRRRNKQGV
ncbi:MAG: hypothetical protein OXR62_06660 [Ahrensia sp.]|nr:hypothetical protein [Ahrensia sp.]